jgi:2-polyprenyl-6-methoxyphenol hydroxylase-like FAD-dependent oxidoreductase
MDVVKMTDQNGSAVVLGAGLGGLVAARVLADRYERVTIIERDRLPTEGPRKGVPQGRHAHGLLARGRAALEELFPGFTADVTAAGGLPTDLQNECRWYQDGNLLRQEPSELSGLLASRPLLEATVRRHVLSLGHVTIREGAGCDRLLAEGRTVRGVVVEGEDVPADLVVDATGRGSRTPRWLAELGGEAPVIEEVQVDIAYASRVYRRRPEHLDGDTAVSIAPTPKVRRGGTALAMEGDRWIIMLSGYRGEHPPLDPAGYESFASTILSGEIADIIRTSEPLTDPVPFTYPRSRRVRYERLRDFPDGYLVFGDAICSFNPVYGQGMTVAALEALALRDCLGQPDLARRFLAKAANLVDVPWDIAVGGDRRFPEVAGPRTPKVRIINAYLARLKKAAASDGHLALAFLRVANLMDRPESLLAPPVAWRVLKGNVRVPQHWTRLPPTRRSAGPSATVRGSVLAGSRNRPRVFAGSLIDPAGVMWDTTVGSPDT